MQIIIQHNTMIPIYEQITEQIKTQIFQGILLENEALPSVRQLAKELKISALTVKKAYDELEQAGLIQTVHGKGSFVKKVNNSLKKEEQLKDTQAEFEKIILKSRIGGLIDKEIKEIFNLIMEDD